ncbi:aspartyl-phosphate phosphatase Spo0E family protein [Lentibacillus cibarius]|uniref:Aspartyl-phosphate phosphatase Spo0E family protein n=1 Tax=Lentibacillus cibarius TaxID=2583219 RepID=A0A5S3QIU9_9BACI|nr:aspartyl-phosphate phosphatase Spo0E family protein [Lentibacillus cibarius]TMN21844.1 aspartyl-phosphate phosphatase Spo0E family protein [Lentibacillus cibarius]
MLITDHKITTDYLLELINHKKETMIKVAETFGFNSDKTLECSQELDELIIKHQRMTKLERKSTT